MIVSSYALAPAAGYEDTGTVRHDTTVTGIGEPTRASCRYRECPQSTHRLKRPDRGGQRDRVRRCRRRRRYLRGNRVLPERYYVNAEPSSSRAVGFRTISPDLSHALRGGTQKLTRSTEAVTAPRWRLRSSHRRCRPCWPAGRHTSRAGTALRTARRRRSERGSAMGACRVRDRAPERKVVVQKARP